MVHPARRQEQRGTSTVEFALISVPLILLLFGIIQYGWYFYVAETASGAASNVTRRLSVGDCWTGTQAYDLAKSQSPRVTSLAKSPSSLTGAVPGTTQLRITVTADAKILNFYPLPNGGIVTRTVQARLEDTTAGSAC